MAALSDKDLSRFDRFCQKHWHHHVLLDLPAPRGRIWVDPEIAALYQRFLPGFRALQLPEAAAYLYAERAFGAIRDRRFIHLSHRRHGVPVSAEIGPDGRCFICIKHSEFERTVTKVIKLAYDVLDQTVVVRAVERFGQYDGKKVNPRYLRCRRAEERAREDLKNAPWMLKEYLHGTYAIDAEQKSWKSVTITEQMESDLYTVSRQSEHPPMATILHYIHQILQQLVDIHAVGGVHRDIKGENILVSHPQVKIFDFGFYRENARDSFKWLTHIMAAPEYAQALLKGEYDASVIAPACDVWAAGLTFLELHYGDSGSSPWAPHQQDYSREEMWHAIVNCTEDWIPREDHPSPLTGLYRGMLARDPAKRCTAQQALEFFERWFEPSLSLSTASLARTSIASEPEERKESLELPVCDAI